MIQKNSRKKRGQILANSSQMKISRWDHNDYFPKRKLEWWACGEYYMTDKGIKVYKYINVLGMLMLVLLTPYFLFTQSFKQIMVALGDHWKYSVGEFEVKKWDDLYHLIKSFQKLGRSVLSKRN